MTEYTMIEVTFSGPDISEYEVLSSAHHIKLFRWKHTLLITTANHAAEMLTH